MTSLLASGTGGGDGADLVGARLLRRPLVLSPRTPLLDALKLFRNTRSQVCATRW